MRPLIDWFEPPVLHIPLPDGFPFKEIPIHGFGVLVALGFLAGSKLAMNRARRVGLDPEEINRLVGQLVIGTFIGGHVGYGLMYKPAEYLANPVQFLHVWEGLSSMGGFLVCVPLSAYFFMSRKLKVWPYLDCLAIGLTVGWFFGRMGCFVAHDHPGPATDFWLGVYGMCPPMGQNTEIACHDLGLYEALWSLCMFGVFAVLDRKPKVPGFYPLVLGLSYAPVRFVMDLYRPDVTDARWWGGLTPAQYVCILLFAVGSYFLYQRVQSKETPVWAPPGATGPAKQVS